MVRRLTPEDRARITQEFFKTKRGIWLKSHQKDIRIALSFICFMAFAILTIGTFIPADWSIRIPIGRIDGYDLTYFAKGYTVYYNNGNILDDIIFTKIASHHLTDIMSMWISYYILVFKLKSWIFPLLMVTFVIAVHEYGWWISYIFAHIAIIWGNQQWEQIYFSNNLTLIYFFCILGYFEFKGWSRQEFKWIAYMICMYTFWILIGFPVTDDFNGLTIYAHNIYVILLEEFSWTSSFVMFFKLIDINKIKRRWL
jgi:hypothetical protein